MDTSCFDDLRIEAMVLQRAADAGFDVEPFLSRVRVECEKLIFGLDDLGYLFAIPLIRFIHHVLCFTPPSMVTPDMATSLDSIIQAFSDGVPSDESYRLSCQILRIAGFNTLQISRSEQSLVHSSWMQN
jgi:hypothetical protein